MVMDIDILGHRIEIDEGFIAGERGEIRRQLEEYENGELKEFDLETEFPDSFTGKVMEAMQEIDYSQTRTYGEIAEELDTSAVAVGQACSRNPVPVIIPCHRIVSRTGVGGYQYGKLKEKLLELERPSQAP